MAYISFQPRDQFSATVQTGNSSSQAITIRTGFSPSAIWNKRTDATGTTMYNFFSTIGTGEYQKLYETVADTTDAASITSFDANGFTLGSGLWNATSSTYVNYCWNGDSTSVPSGGTITPSAANVNTTSGYAMFRYTGNGTAGATIAHGLGKIPKHIIIKGDRGSGWVSDNGTNAWDSNFLKRNSYASQASHHSPWNATAPTSTLFSLGNDADVNQSAEIYTAMVWTDITGYSKFGTFNGNSNADGPFIYTGFTPKFVEIKKYNTGSCNWVVWDTNKNPSNQANWYIYTDDGGSNNGYVEAGTNNNNIDILSNGFKIKSTLACLNGGNMRYAAFAENPIVSSNNVPGVAR
jgi:hypothetical protein|tara:strand:- start:137 stop:1186 length:1050 start_codon:yes stop_codon:yes gene_type:complete